MKPSQLIISIIFLAITLASSLKIAGIIGYYTLFTEDFIETLCENKNKPELQCNGKCALSQIIAQDSQEKNAPLNLEFLKIETLFFLHSLSEVRFPSVLTTHSFDLIHTDNYNFRFSDRIKHPPRV
ncbi:hypothetical protein [Zobellia uliginosa]|uniref:hypothetical protein n=1 Tax=Zobellia uliginosa TaxID=143224 RepID=UPI001C075189|nr:hypothetical protein [Zobellia uliginosa]MBU2945382.1 hypothetical protein [Zobellia uliginosa]